MRDRQVDGGRLRDLRVRAGIRIPELASAVKCSPGHIRNIELCGFQSSDELTHRIRLELGKAHGREISLDEFTDPKDSNGEAA